MAVKIDTKSISNLGRIIQFHRKQARLSRIELADIAGVGKTVIYDIETGKETIQMKTLLKILGALNISIALESPLMERYQEGSNAES
jgi:HTH-type transcriptional regulator / antitoxin HipB